MLGVSKTLEEEPKPYGPPMWHPVWRQPGTRNLLIGYHEPDEYCFYDYCSCQDCHTFFVTEPPGRGVEVATLEVSRPRYSYMCLVNPVRDAVAKREKDRQEKLRGEREAAAAAVEASKKDKASNDQPKNDECVRISSAIISKLFDGS